MSETLSDDEWLRRALIDFGWSQADLARFMIEKGDRREFQVILCNINWALTGAVRLGGEMRALLTVLRGRLLRLAEMDARARPALHRAGPLPFIAAGPRPIRRA
jgi:hypothetical protein